MTLECLNTQKQTENIKDKRQKVPIVEYMELLRVQSQIQFVLNQFFPDSRIIQDTTNGLGVETV